MRGEYKVPGGKLVAAEVEVDDGILSTVRISGDFFAEPDDALENIDRALTGMPEDASVQQMSAVVTAAIGPQAHLIGFDADAVAIAVRRAVGRATSWSDHTFQIIHGAAETPQLQMALDQALTESVADGTRPPTLRIWEWERNAVVIGSFQSYRNEIDHAAAEQFDVTVVRRISGGGAMFIEPGNTITYSLYVPGSLVEGLSFERSYAFLDDWVLGALSELGIAARYVPLNDITSPVGKIGGAAQKRLASRDAEARNKLGGAVLHHVTMAYDIDAGKMTQVLRIGREKLSDKGTASANKRVDPLRSQTGMPRADVIDAFKDHFRGRYRTADGVITESERRRAEQLVTEKFGTGAWLHRVP
ncbi:biotin/lipoate A/B protein ligase family protein [Microlunatus sp. Gsoil 973]|uniref:lipoate--protein ligase family protein n=1 Tax=Microlunatus sp. Gsoil 973 TaxID=2672569 RepID=UPI0012B4B969|nr:biotin/lipoate A/B protein ligase family protein [Microlunatus sp. Gsoil 973]QGN32456.1 lipoate--protein ligase family protein [Microlunatus sp. Gsoil 973]